MAESREGGCQCGGIRYAVPRDPVAIGICHCRECQRASGSAFGMSFVVARDDFRLLKGTLKKFTRSSDSGRQLDCLFCPDCGTRIYHLPRYADGIFNVRLGTLDDPSGLVPTREIWMSRKHAWLETHLPADAVKDEGQPF